MTFKQQIVTSVSMILTGLAITIASHFGWNFTEDQKAKIQSTITAVVEQNVNKVEEKIQQKKENIPTVEVKK